MQNNRRYGSYYKYGIISFMLDKSQSVIKQQPFFHNFMYYIHCLDFTIFFAKNTLPHSLPLNSKENSSIKSFQLVKGEVAVSAHLQPQALGGSDSQNALILVHVFLSFALIEMVSQDKRY